MYFKFIYFIKIWKLTASVKGKERINVLKNMLENYFYFAKKFKSFGKFSQLKTFLIDFSELLIVFKISKQL